MSDSSRPAITTAAKTGRDLQAIVDPLTTSGGRFSGDTKVQDDGGLPFPWHRTFTLGGAQKPDVPSALVAPWISWISKTEVVGRGAQEATLSAANSPSLLQDIPRRGAIPAVRGSEVGVEFSAAELA